MGQLVDDMNAYVMGFFLSLSAINVWENANTFWTRRKKLDALQLVASTGQIINLILHMILNTAQDLPCYAVAWTETFFYYVLQIGSAYVIIYRATAIITNNHRRYLVRAILGLLQAFSLAFTLPSIVLMDMEVIDGTCDPVYQREYNNICKIFLAVLYVGILLAFCVPVIKNIRASNKYMRRSAIKDIATITTIKIIIAILGEIITVILSLLGVFGAYYWIEFSIQNYSVVWASTVASRKIPKENENGISLATTSATPSRKTTNSRETDKGFSPPENQSV